MQTLLAENWKVKVTPLACLNSTSVSVLLSMTKNHHLGNLSVIVKREFTRVTCTRSYSGSTKESSIPRGLWPTLHENALVFLEDKEVYA